MAFSITTALVLLYIAGFWGTFWLQTNLPVTFGLAVARCAVWPVYLATGWPHGTPLRMD